MKHISYKFFKNKKNFYKCLFIILIVIFLFFCPTIGKTAYAEETISNSSITDEDLEQELEDEVQEQLGDLDFSSLEEILQALTDGELAIFGGSSFIDKLGNLINGNFDDGTNLWSAILTIFFDNLLKLIQKIYLIPYLN